MKKTKAKYFTADTELLIKALQEATKEEDIIKVFTNNNKNTRVELIKQDDDSYFMIINREKRTGIPVRYNNENMSCIDIPDGDYFGELYYALIDKDVIVAISVLGQSLQNSLRDAIYSITNDNNASSINPELDIDSYDKFQDALQVQTVDFKLYFNNKDEAEEFCNTHAGSNFAHWFDYGNKSLEMKLSCNKKNKLDDEIYNLVDNIIRKSFCKRLKVKYLNANEEIVETNLLTPKIQCEKYIDDKDFLDESVILSFLNDALKIRKRLNN